MKLYILDKYRITKFNLPEKIEDSFLVPYIGYNDKENYVTVEAKDGNWQLRSNGSVNIYEGTNVLDKTNLTDYSSYFLKILGQEEMATLFALPSIQEENYKLEVFGLNSITIGSSLNVNVSYKNSLTAEIHAEIKLVNNEWYLAASADDRFRTYVNSKRVMTAKLECGDIIFINGLKIIWMKTFIKINNPNQAVSVSGLKPYEELDNADNTKYTPVTDEEATAVLYDDSDYFYHMPRIRSILEEETVKIDSPPNSEIREELPFILTVGTSATMAMTSLISVYTQILNISSGKMGIVQAIPALIACVAMLAGSVIFPRVTKAYQKKQAKKKEQKRQTKYKEYLDKKQEEINLILKKQEQILRENYPQFQQCATIIRAKNRFLWSREIPYDDFLRIRVGVGNVPAELKIEAPEKHFTLDEDNLFEMVYNVVNNSKTLNNVPVTISFIENNIMSFIFSCSYKDEYVKNMILQLIAFHSPVDLKLVIFTSKKNAPKWEYAKFLPHCWSDDKETRFFATDQIEMRELSSKLEEILKTRKETNSSSNKDNSDLDGEITTDTKSAYLKYPPYYLFVIDDYKTAKNIPIVEMIEKQNSNFGFSLMLVSNTMKQLPSNCSKFVEVGEKEGCVLENDVDSQAQQLFTVECDQTINMREVSSQLANVPTITKEGMSSLPQSLSFLEMYGVSKIEQLNISNKWKNNNPVLSLSTPIGVHADGEQFKLDLHEKFHGPHGLIAGSTGSGKSEFIITYILSMCVNYHPYEVQFVLIDYKGGGLAGAFENKETGVKVPHLVGTITNLDTAEMNRTLVSISSELKRRQRKFNEVKDKLDESTMDIYKYQRLYREGLIDEPMAHLFIISDEFAELKSQQPEFLSELVSTARIGRSLGVHLILATQKPSGVVNDQIWSNSKFKICLKVQDRGDSMEMLKRPEAASIKETGRFYLQVGYDDYFDVGQSGWGGAKYVPTDRVIKKVDDSISFVENTGNVIKTVNDIVKKENTEDLGEQLTNIVKYIYELGKKDELQTKKLWLDKIPEEIFINDLKKKYSYKPTPFSLTPVVGEYDNPAAQEQNLLTLNLSQTNTLIFGQGGSGKENLLTTLLYSAMIEHTPEEVSFYIIDCGAETLKMFYKMPHVGSICTVDESEKIMTTLKLIDDEFEYRKELFADYAGSYENYIKNSGQKIPTMILVINNYDIFSETYQKIADAISTLYRDGSKYGICIIMTGMTPTSLKARSAQYFDNKICMQIAGGDYRTAINAPKGMVPAKCFGRGLVTKGDDLFEFQTAYICPKDDINKLIQSTAKQLNEAYTVRAKTIKVVPNVVTLDTVAEKLTGLNSVPIGFDLMKKDIYAYDFLDKRITNIVGDSIENKIPFMDALIKQISSLPNVNYRVFDFKNQLESVKNDNIIRDNLDRSILEMYNEVVGEEKSDKTNIYILAGVGSMANKLNEQTKQYLNNLLMSITNFKKSCFILFDDSVSFKSVQLEQWYQSQVDKANGIWLGENIASQMTLSVKDLTPDDRKISFPNMVFAINNGSHILIKGIVDMEEKNEE